MKLIQKIILFCALSIVALLGSYYYNFRESHEALYEDINVMFQKEAPYWGEYIFNASNPPFKGSFNSDKYRKKTKTTIISEVVPYVLVDTIEISTKFYHPNSIVDYFVKNRETMMLLGDTCKYDIQTADSLFVDALKKKNIVAKSSVELKIRDIHQMFPRVDSMCQDAPFVKIISSGTVEGYTTQPVGVGICDHGMLYGHVKVSPSEVLARMDWFGLCQILTLVLIALLWIIGVYFNKYFSLWLYFKKHTVLVGNTCIDIHRQKLYLWNGECRTFSGTKLKFMKLLLEAAPNNYKLSKEEVCRSIWNRKAKDGQALYNVTMTDMRNLFISEDPALELHSYPKEGVQMIEDSTQIRKHRCRHFAWIYIQDFLKKRREEKEFSTASVAHSE